MHSLERTTHLGERVVFDPESSAMHCIAGKTGSCYDLAGASAIMTRSIDESENPKQSYFIRTFGCQMNVADTEQMAATLEESGYVTAGGEEEADLIIVNGCSVREKAVHKAVSALGTLQKLKDRNKRKRPLIGLGGCVGQLEKDQLFQRAPYLDFVFGPDAIDQLPEIVFETRKTGLRQHYTEFDRSKSYSTKTKISKLKRTAFVNVMKGCDKYCTYCIVPFTRGREKSRTIDEVLGDVSSLVSKGVREVTLLGQNVNSFGKGNPNTRKRVPLSLRNPIGPVGPRDGEENFPQLLWAIEEDPRLRNLERIRFTSSHPLDFSDELIDCYSAENGVKKLAAHLHLPVQSGADSVLKRMGRHHRIQEYIEQMERLREIRPEVALSTDLIVGFPGETRDEFEETLSLLDRLRYDSLFAFAYSPRPGTRAAKLPDDVSLKEKKWRLNTLLDHQKKISSERNRDKVGETLKVLVEGEAKSQSIDSVSKLFSNRKAGRIYSGRSSCNRLIHFCWEAESGRNLAGELISVKVSNATALALYGDAQIDPLAADGGAA